MLTATAPPATDHRCLNLVIGGHVDHGKSTIIGRLLADTRSLPEGKLEQVRARCERNSKPFEYAFLLDALKDEQAQGITIDAARVFFKTAQRPCILIDAPGHIEFLRNLITGAARAEAALLVIDAKEGVRENSRRHGYMMGMLGIRQLVVLVNKMDLVGYDRAVFERIQAEFRAFLTQLGVEPGGFIPVSGREGDNIACHAESMPWYEGPTVLETLDRFRSEAPDADKPFRLSVQDVYKFTGQGDDRRIVAGTIDAGRVSAGDDVVFYPSGKKARVASIEGFSRKPQLTASAGEATGFTLAEQLYVARGEIATVAGQPRPQVATRLKASIFWLGREPLVKQKEYMLKLGTTRVPVRVEDIHRVLDASTLKVDDAKDRVDRHEVAECTLQTSRPIAFDLASDLATTSRFVLVEDFEIRGGGIVREALPGSTKNATPRRESSRPGSILASRRAERYHQRAALVVVAGGSGFARQVEESTFEAGHIVTCIEAKSNSARSIDRLVECANLLLDSGIIVIAGFADLEPEELSMIREQVGAGRVLVVSAGGADASELAADLIISDPGLPGAARQVRTLLQERGIVFKPW
ncbi:MAG: GTP-binding protein [Planctomycetota bacterium]